ncbi:uncharacterized protein LOC110880070 isoform X2 [Helianthus annuus]|uniref:uncharacterized protein LOC110880070 isoform X2 n=1 Tax=Helianthus annuus TaxID=4232 RepID=UPI001652FD6B|nr:uncharacterized protein LOC110880070 isoform X2 [Helianthus annuus]
MEHQTPTRTQSLNSDFISTLPQNIIKDILTRMPLRSTLGENECFVKEMAVYLAGQLNKYKLVSAIFRYLLLHNGPTIVEFDCSFVHLHMESEFAQIISYLARGSTVKQLFIFSDNRSFKLPVLFFSLQGLEVVHLHNCTLEPPLTFNGVSLLTSMTFRNVEVSAQMLQRFISKCTLLQSFFLIELEKGIESIPGGNNFTLVDLSQYVPLLETFAITKHYMKVLFKLKITSDVRMWCLLILTLILG